MALYENYPTINYNGFVVKDITIKLGVLDHLKNVVSVYENYIIENGDTPEIVAHKFYDDAELHWIILMMNDIIDPLFDWPLDIKAFDAYVTANYGAGNEHKPHHYEDNGLVIYYVPPDINNPYVNLPANLTLVTNRMHEERINEEKRKIKILDKQYIADIESEARNVLNG